MRLRSFSNLKLLKKCHAPVEAPAIREKIEIFEKVTKKLSKLRENISRSSPLVQFSEARVILRVNRRTGENDVNSTPIIRRHPKRTESPKKGKRRKRKASKNSPRRNNKRLRGEKSNSFTPQPILPEITEPPDSVCEEQIGTK